jgi:hypothetical protein
MSVIGADESSLQMEHGDCPGNLPFFRIRGLLEIED